MRMAYQKCKLIKFRTATTWMPAKELQWNMCASQGITLQRRYTADL